MRYERHSSPSSKAQKSRKQSGYSPMPGKNSVRQLVETIVSQVLERHVSALREELIAHVVGELLPNLATSTGTAPKLLRQAASSIHGSTAQKEILAALLDGAGHFCG